MTNNKSSFTTTHGKNPKQIHIAHRRSPSELTNLMMEQIQLQHQLELVQQQQQRILQQQQQQQQQQQRILQQQQLQFNSNSSSQFNHRRNSPSTHRRSQSSVTGAMGSFQLPQQQQQQQLPQQSALAPPPKLSSAQGHNRRHSLGLNEAKKAAAQVQAQRAGKEIEADDVEVASSTQQPLSGFKFPSTPIESPLQRNTQTHNRSRSMANQVSPQRSFQFPPPMSPSASSAANQFLSPGEMLPLLPPQQPNFHERRLSGHFRSNSRNNNYDINSNWRRQQSPPRGSFNDDSLNLSPFVPGHRSRNSHGNNSSNSSITGFQNQLGSTVGTGGRKSLFEPYLPQSSIPELVAEGRLVVGTLRVNKKNRSDAYVSTDGLLDADIFICGSKDRNRALEGDLVAVELLSVDEVWSSKREKEEKKRRKDNSHGQGEVLSSEDVHNDASTHASTQQSSTISSSGSSITENNDESEHAGLKRRGSLKQRPTLKKNDDVEVEGQSLLLVEEEEISDESKPLYAGHVVAVIDRIPGQLFSGTLGLLRPSQNQQPKDNQYHQNKPKIVWFKPTDKKVPLIAIPTEQAPKDFVENVDNYSGKLFVASIKRWPITSLHPFGTLIGELGEMNNPTIEVEAILRDNNFICDEYLINNKRVGHVEDPEERNDFELIELDLAEEYKKRKDFTNEYVLALSETGELSDFAIHVKRLDEGKIELGVHISDVTAFIKEGSNLDKNARKRSTSVILAQKVVHLLPKKINELLSFEKNIKNLTLSICFEIDTNKFEVDNIWIGEAYIQPKIKLNFDEIDLILQDSQEVTEISSASKDYIKTFSLISREFRRQRLENPKLNIETNLTLLDQIDDEKIRLHLNLFKTNMSHNVLSEIFLKVNSTIAQRNYAILGDGTFLRRQQLPTLTKLESFKKRVSSFKDEDGTSIVIDTTSNSSLINSILNIKNETTRQAVEILFYKTLSRSRYFIAGKVEPENFGAFYFNLPLYTHFTSPLRRYSDFIVHRQLKLVLSDKEDKSVSDDEIESLKMTAEYCNFKKDCAKSAQDQSIHLILSKTINEMSKNTGQLIVEGFVLQVYESAFDVYIPEFGIEKRVHGDQLPLKKCEFDKKKGILELYWEKNVDSATFTPEDEKNNRLSYRRSIKNKFQIGANEIARVLSERRSKEISEELSSDLSKLKLDLPIIFKTNEDLQEFFKDLKLRSDKVNGDYIQEVAELSKVPILLRSEIGMALPCLTVHALNPYING